MRLLGYSTAAAQDLLDAPPCKVGDAIVQLTDSQQSARARKVEKGELQPQIAGCNGYSPFLRALRYLDYNDLWMLPIFHAGKALHLN